MKALILALAISAPVLGDVTLSKSAPAPGDACTAPTVVGHLGELDAVIYFKPGKVVVRQVEAPCSGTLEILRARIKGLSSSSAQYRFCLYADRAGEPGALVYQGPQAWAIGSGLVAVSHATPALELGVGTYYVGTLAQVAGSAAYSARNGACSGCFHEYTATWPDCPDPWPTGLSQPAGDRSLEASIQIGASP